MENHRLFVACVGPFLLAILLFTGCGDLDAIEKESNVSVSIQSLEQGEISSQKVFSYVAMCRKLKKNNHGQCVQCCAHRINELKANGSLPPNEGAEVFLLCKEACPKGDKKDPLPPPNKVLNEVPNATDISKQSITISKATAQ